MSHALCVRARGGRGCGGVRVVSRESNLEKREQRERERERERARENERERERERESERGETAVGPKEESAIRSCVNIGRRVCLIPRHLSEDPVLSKRSV